MDTPYTIFVAYASMQALLQLETLLKKHDLQPSLQILADVADYGIKRGTERFFPDQPRPPFAVNPIEDVVAALRFHYSLSSAPLNNPTPVPITPQSQEQERHAGYRMGEPSRIGKPPAAAADSSRRFIAPCPTPAQGIDRPPTSAEATPVPPGGFRTPVPITPTKIQSIPKSAVFPWERRSSGNDDSKS